MRKRAVLLLLLSVFGSISFLPAAASDEAHTPYYTYPTLALSIEEFFAAFDYDNPALTAIGAAVADGDYERAAKELHAYMASNKAGTQELFGIGPLRSHPFTIRLPDPDR
ncbi:MAG: hypothetical protein GX162_00020, partial [Firmicutes bacterium]|nr:hypothetical protein [Bacillota bacterium]